MGMLDPLGWLVLFLGSYSLEEGGRLNDVFFCSLNILSDEASVTSWWIQISL